MSHLYKVKHQRSVRIFPVSSYDIRYALDSTDISNFDNLSPVTADMVAFGFNLNPVPGGDTKTIRLYAYMFSGRSVTFAAKAIDDEALSSASVSNQPPELTVVDDYPPDQVDIKFVVQKVTLTRTSPS